MERFPFMKTACRIVGNGCRIVQNVHGMLPDENGMLPDEHGMLPDEHGMLPDGDGIQPDGDGIVPDDNGMKQNADGMKPDGDGIEPDEDGIEPDEDGMLCNAGERSERGWCPARFFLCCSFTAGPIKFWYRPSLENRFCMAIKTIKTCGIMNIFLKPRYYYNAVKRKSPHCWPAMGAFPFYKISTMSSTHRSYFSRHRHFC